GSGIGRGFGGEAGDRVEYGFDLPEAMRDAVLLVRYRAGHGPAAFALAGSASGELRLPASDDLAVSTLPLGDLPAGRHALRLTSTRPAPVELDGLAIAPAAVAADVRFSLHAWNPVPTIELRPDGHSLILKYDDVAVHYGLAWTGDDAEVRQIYAGELDRTLRYYVHEHVQKVLRGPGEGHFTNVFVRPIAMPPHERRALYGLVCVGEREGVCRRLDAFLRDMRSFPAEAPNPPAPFPAEAPNPPAPFPAREGGERPSPGRGGAGGEVTIRGGAGGEVSDREEVAADGEINPSGQPYLFSQQRMAATLLTNVVYPIYTRRRYIRHFTPGKWWDCLYTWDSGFIALGLLELDIERAIDCLNAYTTPPGDEHAAFIHHGSPAPIQIYAFLELWNRTQERALLEYFYPRLRQMYLFLAGRLGSSTTRTLKSGLLKTWDYFYNSAGWDDYPPQVYVHRHGLEATVAPAINTAHAIRTGKILRLAARALGLEDDVADYAADIAAWTDALNRYAWDAEAGYFSYVVHDDAGRPVGILRHESGANYDMGLDGASPFFAGICNAGQEAALIGHLSSAGRLWTRIGLSTVDQAAPYYKVDGYWNGAVWMPYQWIVWKALLDRGHGDLAHRIGHTALEVWRAEVDATYNCFEHFIVQSGRGAGWHHFGGLSAPVLSWFGAYHRPGRLTCGFDVWVARQEFRDGHRTLVADLHGRPGLVLVTMAAGPAYRATWNGEPVPVRELHDGTLEIALNGRNAPGRLIVAPDPAAR
ncbi:MAG: MGH1-like glycoside hydrolase domain-containing protein, partial [Anaerolineae bacterium]